MTPTPYRSYHCATCATQYQRSVFSTAECPVCKAPMRLVAANTSLPSSLAQRVLSSTPVPAPPGPVVQGAPRVTIYCQNPAQSGDTTGVGMALALLPQTRLLFCVSADEVARAKDYLRFYSELGVAPERLVLVIGDKSASSREGLMEIQTALEDEQVVVDQKAAQAERARVKANNTALSQRKREDAAEEAQSARATHFTKARELLEKRFAQRAEIEVRSTFKSEAVNQARRDFAGIVGDVITWDHLEERGGNQLYQDLLNAGVRTTKGSNLRASYASFFDANSARFCDIGQTTRDVAAHLDARGLRSTVHAIRQKFTDANLPKVDDFVEQFHKKLMAAQPTIRAKGRTPTLVLIWVRGLNSSELKQVQESGLTPSAINDSVQARLDTFKRNPQHVMTVQLYEAIRHAAQTINNKKEYQAVNDKRWLIPVPIGDELMLDWYDSNRRRESNLYQGSSDLNLIQFFKRVDSFTGSRYAQMYFLHKLTLKFNTIQLGIRSGAMEQGMYMGVPTIYFEEKDSPSGARMASLATDLTSYSVVSPMDYASAKRLPFFYRLKTQHLIGLNQARTRESVEQLVNAFRNPDAPVDGRVSRGCLTESELQAMTKGLAGICKQLDVYGRALL